MPESNIRRRRKSQRLNGKKSETRLLPVNVVNRQRKYAFDLARLEAETRRAVARLRKKLSREVSEVVVVLVSAGLSGKVHGRFAGDPEPTDVITFSHGEILVCPSVAERQRRASGLGLHEEVLTYICHGLLHLCGEEDETEEGFRRMARRQEALRREVAAGAV